VRYPDTPAFQQALVGHLGLPVVAAEAPQITDALQRLIGQKRLHAFTADAQRVQHEARELRNQMEHVISQLNYVPGVEAALLADGNGMALVHWERVAGSELGAVAGLAVGALSATRELAALLGARTTGSLIIQEFEAQTVIVARIARQHVLLLIVAPDTALGAIRLTLRRLIAQLEPLARGNLLRLRSARPASKVKLL
jgi:predicted regulator of Ras-like GTPase activity (Roadblock/LC7/MglB family)